MLGVGPHSIRAVVVDVIVVAVAVDQNPDVMENGVWQVWPHGHPGAAGWRLVPPSSDCWYTGPGRMQAGALMRTPLAVNTYYQNPNCSQYYFFGRFPWAL